MKETKLTYAELEVLHYALRMFIEDSNNKDSFNSLHNKLITMRAELEYFSINPEDEEIINTL
jgi:hypothetical protein